MAGVGVPGVEDVAGPVQWLRANHLSGGAVSEVYLIAGRRSNLTGRLDFPAAGGTVGAPSPRQWHTTGCWSGRQ